MYHYLPDRSVGWSRALQGGAITALLFVLGRWAIGWYLRQSDPGSAYGSMGALMLAMVWIYYAALIVFIGALTTAVIDEREGAAREPERGAGAARLATRRSSGPAEARTRASAARVSEAHRGFEASRVRCAGPGYDSALPVPDRPPARPLLSSLGNGLARYRVRAPAASMAITATHPLDLPAPAPVLDPAHRRLARATSAWDTWRRSPTASRRATGSCRSPPPAPASSARSACATCCAPAGDCRPSSCWRR